MKSLNKIIDDLKSIGEPVIRLGRGQYAVEETIVASGPFAIIGSGPWFSQLYPSRGVLCFELSAANKLARRFNSTSPSNEHELGVSVSGVSIHGTQEVGQSGIGLSGRCDEIDISNCTFENLQQAITGGDLDREHVGYCRECRIHGIIIRGCGDLGIPAAELSQRTSTVPQDGMNNLTLWDWRIIHSKDVGLRIADYSPTEFVRLIDINGIMAHGGPDATRRTKQPVISIEGGVRGLQIRGLRGAGFAESVVRVEAIGTGRPRCVSINGQITGQSLGVDLRAVDGCVVNLQSFGDATMVATQRGCTGVIVNCKASVW